VKSTIGQPLFENETLRLILNELVPFTSTTSNVPVVSQGLLSAVNKTKPSDSCSVVNGVFDATGCVPQVIAA
jgi:hypothetical protein